MISNTDAWIKAVSKANARRTIEDEPERWLPVIPSLDVEHTIDSPFCMDMTCGCHDDLELLAEQNAYIDAGLLTVWEFLRTINGKQL